jgi:hypothetical protein
VVAGYLFEPERCKALEDEWASALGTVGVSVFHTSDCAYGTGAFAGKSKDERSSVYIKLVNAITRHATKGVAVQISSEEFDEIKPPGWGDRFGGAYAACATFCILEIGSWCRNNSPGENVAYFFEAGQEHSADAHRFMDLVARHALLKDYYRYFSHSFIPKGSIPLQAADILAWEVNKANVQARKAHKGRSRKSIEALVSVPTKIVLPKREQLRRYLSEMMDQTEGL